MFSAHLDRHVCRLMPFAPPPPPKALKREESTFPIPPEKLNFSLWVQGGEGGEGGGREEGRGRVYTREPKISTLGAKFEV